jgi:hypothetical protein
MILLPFDPWRIAGTRSDPLVRLHVSDRSTSA